MPLDHVSQSLFGDMVQPDSLSLFSSISLDPFALWSLHQDSDLQEDSGIRLLIDATDEVASSDPGITPETFTLRIEETVRGSSSDPVLHIQSPAIRNTFIRSPPIQDTDLSIKLPHVTFQFRSIGSSRPFVFEIGIWDHDGRPGAIRLSSFQTEPRLYFKHFRGKPPASMTDEQQDGSSRTEPLLHLPLEMAANPACDEASLTPWQVVTLPLDKLAKYLSDTSLIPHLDTESMRQSRIFGSFHSISYVKVHANMRLRRVWCSKQLPDHDLAEFQVFS
ncbi:uncharacterized protein UTRI_02235_B [Ustilago trichophora]|uniref:CFA20 domain-containing protein n=1 Tax=Ustilago trichophora TaxID=86804 RepID=A0A5C3DY07_9BASI|nr:uncharacterized protein UTRI_02235_B [Ustilago trichophora]